jgi:hypothetical protein
VSEPEGVPLTRWGRIAAPADSEGAFLLLEKEKPDGWKVAHPTTLIGSGGVARDRRTDIPPLSVHPRGG